MQREKSTFFWWISSCPSGMAENLAVTESRWWNALTILSGIVFQLCDLCRRNFKPSPLSLQILICCKQESVSISPVLTFLYISSLQRPHDTIFLGTSCNLLYLRGWLNILSWVLQFLEMCTTVLLMVLSKSFDFPVMYVSSIDVKLHGVACYL